MSLIWIKRILPFVLTFALGLFIASFFVTLTMPKFRKFERRYEYKRHCYTQRVKAEREAETLRRENERLREELRLKKVELTVVPPIPSNGSGYGYAEGRAVVLQAR